VSLAIAPSAPTSSKGIAGEEASEVADAGDERADPSNAASARNRNKNKAKARAKTDESTAVHRASGAIAGEALSIRSDPMAIALSAIDPLTAQSKSPAPAPAPSVWKGKVTGAAKTRTKPGRRVSIKAAPKLPSTSTSAGIPIDRNGDADANGDESRTVLTGGVTKQSVDRRVAVAIASDPAGYTAGSDAASSKKQSEERGK